MRSHMTEKEGERRSIPPHSQKSLGLWALKSSQMTKKGYNAAKGDLLMAQNVRFYSLVLSTLFHLFFVFVMPYHTLSPWHNSCDFTYLAIPLFSMQHWKIGNRPRDKAKNQVKFGHFQLSWSSYLKVLVLKGFWWLLMTSPIWCVFITWGQ